MAMELLHRKESIILSVIDIINELGIQGLSTRELAKRQGISEGTLFRHFKTKNHIILAVLEYFSKYDADIFHSVKLKELKPREAITFFVDSYATYYENYPAITVMTQIYSVLSYEAKLAPKITSILDERKKFLQQLIEEGQRLGEIRSEADSDILADIIDGTCGAICLTWRMRSYNFSLRDQTLSALRMILDAFSPLK
ncbi:MAG TPA: TetR/AcrR family transcriptional regulator [Patescibacteria group bacterium]|nr:TetR/AcrR family transcriptional regulator [Patescibacteria group bacterium]